MLCTDGWPVLPDDCGLNRGVRQAPVCLHHSPTPSRVACRSLRREAPSAEAAVLSPLLRAGLLTGLDRRPAGTCMADLHHQASRSSGNHSCNHVAFCSLVTKARRFSLESRLQALPGGAGLRAVVWPWACNACWCNLQPIAPPCLHLRPQPSKNSSIESSSGELRRCHVSTPGSSPIRVSPATSMTSG